MNSFKCFVVDDEPLAVDVIVNYLNRLSQFEVIGSFTDPLEAYQALKSQSVDLLFLDIEMPEFNGLDFVKSLSNKPEIVVTTAFREFAVEGFELSILDYLVKPIEFERFMLAIDKFLEKQSHHEPANDTHIMVRADRKFVKVKFDEVLYVEGIKDYVKIVFKDRELLTKTSIGNFADALPVDQFLRVHKSFIVAKDKITAYTHHDVEVGKMEIPIGRVYKEQFLEDVR
jgi:two-component system, LytTR family, response regulator